VTSKTIPKNAIIQEFGLPVGFRDEDVPLPVAEFCFDAANRPLAYALDLAARRGFHKVFGAKNLGFILPPLFGKWWSTPSPTVIGLDLWILKSASIRIGWKSLALALYKTR
jgi:hypothetical protein